MRAFRPLFTLPAVVLLFVSFALDESPYSVLQSWWSDALWPLASPFFLSVPILLLQLRLVWKKRITRAESIIYHVLAIAGLACTALALVRSVLSGEASRLSEVPLYAVTTFLVVAAFRTIALKRRHPEAPLIALMAAWIPNAVLCGLIFWGDWDLGAYLAAFTFVVFAFETVRAVAASPRLPNSTPR